VRARAKLLTVGIPPRPDGGRYDWFGWRVGAASADIAGARLVETHEYFHRQLDDLTAFGGLTATVAALADSQPEDRWTDLRGRLQAMSDLVHESYAVGLSLLTTQRRLESIPGYPTYDRHVRTVRRLLGEDVHPWVALTALRAAALTCMQSGVLSVAVGAGLRDFEASAVARLDRPNHRLVALLTGGYPEAVGEAGRRAQYEHGLEAWWQPAGEVLLSPESMDGVAGEASGELLRQLVEEAETILRRAGAGVVAPDAHHDDLRLLLNQARELAPAGLTRIGALVEWPGGDLIHGGALDSQTIELTAAPPRAVVLPYGSASGVSGEGARRHAFLVVTRAQRIRAAHEVDGIPFPEGESVACLRTTVFDGERRDSLLLLPVVDPTQLAETVPVYVSVLSSAAAADPQRAARWMRWADPNRISLVMDTPASAALLRWCANGARFRTQTRVLRLEGMEVRIIAGRIEEPGRRSPLVIIPSTEFGARWFEAARAEDPVLEAAVKEDPAFFEQESEHLDVVLTHLLFEERYVGPGSWRR
jgi:hypothetical protein